MNENKITDLKIYPDILENHGYKKYNDSMQDKNSYIGSWQKTIYNEHGKAYFINFNFFDNSYYYNLSNQHIITANPYSWEVDLQFNSIDEDMTMNTKIFSSNKNLEEIEKICERLFQKMNFRNYDYYEEKDEDNHKKEIKENLILENFNLLDKELPKNNNKKSKNKI